MFINNNVFIDRIVVVTVIFPLGVFDFPNRCFYLKNSYFTSKKNVSRYVLVKKAHFKNTYLNKILNNRLRIYTYTYIFEQENSLY